LKKIAAENQSSAGIYHVGRIVADHALTISPEIQEARVRIRSLGEEGNQFGKNGPVFIDQSLHGELQISKLREDPPLKGTISQTPSTEFIEYRVKDLALEATIGALTHGGGQDQPILLDVTLRARATGNIHNNTNRLLEGGCASSYIHPARGYFHLIDDIVELVGTSSFSTVEALASKIVDVAFSSWNSRGTPHTLDDVTVRIRKLGIYKEASTVGVEITRTKAMYGSTDSGFVAQLNAKGKHQAFIALGSNLGDRVGMIQRACMEMDQRGIRVVRTSGLWETDAMYVEEQPRFINGACEVSRESNDMWLLLQL
jgi:dihydroneopterin aldolase